MDARPRTCVVLSPDRAAAELAHRRLAERLQARLGPPPALRPHVRRLSPGSAPDGVRSRLALITSPRALVVESALRAWARTAATYPDRYAALWVRPGLMTLQPALAGNWTGADGDAWRDLSAFDLEMWLTPQLSLERLFDGGAQLDRELDAALGLEPADAGGAVSPAEPQAYAQALRALAPPRALHAEVGVVREPLEPGEHPVRQGSSGLRLLGRGWLAPEPHYVWNDGRHATLTIPPEVEGRGWVCRLDGFMVVHPERTTTVTARLGGRVLDTASSRLGAMTDFQMVLLIPPAGPGEAQVVELTFDGVVRPEELGAHGDVRPLACALREIRLEVRSARLPAGGAGRTTGAAPAEDAPLADPELAEVLEAAPLGPVLVAATEDEAARRWSGAVGASRQVRVVTADASALPAALDAEAQALHSLGERVGAVVLADEGAFAPWFVRADQDYTAGMFDAVLVLATGDPDRLPPALTPYDERRPARLEVAAHMTVRRP